ncbi:MAG: isoaspartyl peptidase/L-asparaginase [Flavipsychrobacter sp.]|nr:isoaspartyl peptidase/L-asparaginase [Flavipsychrobacter sp.]
MKQLLTYLFIIAAIPALAQTKLVDKDAKFVLVIHGGAGSVNRKNMTPDKEKAYTDGLQRALTVGYNILVRGGSAVDAVQACIMVLEDDSLFNAGKGAVMTHEGHCELDASIMDGKSLKAGAVAGVTTVRNPICAARAVMEKSRHVMMAGKGAEMFAAENNCSIVDNSYFHTERSRRALEGAIRDDSIREIKQKKSVNDPENRDNKYGTVGAVALDASGNLAAATSTGGMTNKRFGRIGDSPIIGAGTYADNNSCAISCTGWGEYFIRLGMAKAVADRIELKGMKLDDAAKEMILTKLPALGGDGGLIGVDKEGNITMPFNTSGMYRAYIKSTGEKEILMYRD